MSKVANSKCIRVLLLGSQPIILSGLRLLLEAEPGICVVDDAEPLPSSKRLGENNTASSQEEATTTQEGADVTVFDIDGGVDLLEVLAPSIPFGTPVLILSGSIDRDSLALAFRHGATGPSGSSNGRTCYRKRCELSTRVKSGSSNPIWSCS